MRSIILMIVFMLGFGANASAGFNGAELDGIAADPGPGAAVPMDLSFTDEAGQPATLGTAIAGRPAVLIFADYTCRTLCGSDCFLRGCRSRPIRLAAGCRLPAGRHRS